MKQPDFYEILDIDRSAEQDEIKRAYRRLALKYHPDQNRDDSDAEEKFREIQQAYEVLMDPAKRNLYDCTGNTGFDDLLSRFSEGSSFFDQFFSRTGGPMSQRGRGCGRRGGGRCRFRREGFAGFPNNAGEIYNLNITRQQALKGAETKIKINRGWSEVLLLVKIPAGIGNGSVLKLADSSGLDDLLIRINYINE